jgi:hypothetical protein
VEIMLEEQLLRSQDDLFAILAADFLMPGYIHHFHVPYPIYE